VSRARQLGKIANPTTGKHGQFEREAKVSRARQLGKIANPTAAEKKELEELLKKSLVHNTVCIPTSSLQTHFCSNTQRPGEPER